MLISILGVAGGIICAYGFFGYNWLSFTKHAAIVWTGAGFILALASSIPAVWAIETYLDARHEDDEQEPPQGQPQRQRRDPSDQLTFEQEHAPASAETEAVQNQTLPNQISRVPYQFTRDQWLALVHSLCPNPAGSWRWNKKNLRRAKIFTVPIAGANITATGVYGRICTNFERAEIIEYKSSKWIVTEPGKNALCVAAGLEVIPW